MALNILNTDEACHGCIKHYACKHKLRKGGQFEIDCSGIPKSYVSDEHAAALPAAHNAAILLDPVRWAAEVLDWHCLDEDGSVWERKAPEEYYRLTEEYPGRASKFHRPYQAEMLRCTSRRKVFRIGRQAGKTETLVISMLFNMFTNSNFKIVLITPFQSQIDLIFKRLEELIKSRPALANSIKRNVKAPQYSMELYNGSYVKGFTAGTKSGSGAASARGQPANMLVFDEADYLNPADMDAAMAIITNCPDATIWMSSTPSGKREKFYDSCLDTEWKEFHHPSSVNPNWTPKLERFFRRTLTDIGFRHEVLADFGEQEEGVFQVEYVEAAQAEYTYDDMSPQASWLYSIGVDWNSPAVGTTIRVVGFNPANSKFYVVDREIVQRAGWTQLSACEAIAKMNRKWRPFAIYVDKGYGATQVEILHKFGYDSLADPEKGPSHVDSRLPHIVKAYDFGSKIETRDPFTKQKLSKPAKGFLVESSIRRFESKDIFFPEDDQQLAAELMGYVIKNVTPTGQLIYGTNSDTIGDHNLDALMLSLVAFTLEKTNFGKPPSNESINFTTILGDDPTDVGIKVKSEARKSRAEASRPNHDRSNFMNQASAHGHRDRNSLPSWTEPSEKRERIKEAAFISNRSDSTRGRSGVLSGGRRGRDGPPKRRNI